MNGNNYVLTEIWKARESWIALSKAERETFLNEKINPFLGQMVGEGAEILGCALNDNSGDERIAYDYMAIWRVPSKEFSEKIEKGAKELGFLDYFEQVNFSGTLISPPELNNSMLNQ